MSMPFRKKPFTFTQPDGTELDVYGWGDQHRAHFETADGFVVRRNPDTGFFERAERADRIAEETGLETTVQVRGRENRGLDNGGSRWQMRRQERLVRSAATLRFPSSRRSVVGEFRGLCLLIEFPDVRGTITREEVESFCNQPGYNGFGNNGSVCDYFMDASAKQFHFTNVVAPCYVAKHPRSYYTDASVDSPMRARELILEALLHLKETAFDFSSLSTDDKGYVYALNVLYAGPVVNTWSKGLWPHAHHLETSFDVSGGKLVFDYQITSMGSELSLGVFCHENGHMVCDFPDLYDLERDSSGAGVYCLMSWGGKADPRNPVQLSAYLKFKAGWASVRSLKAGTKRSAIAGRNEFLIHRKDAFEYFLLENRQQQARDAALSSAGLAIWHIDELGNNSYQQRAATHHYECSLVQADGNFDLECGRNLGDESDLFSAATNSAFSDDTSPRAEWWDGSSVQLRISNIGASSSSISFNVS